MARHGPSEGKGAQRTVRGHATPAFRVRLARGRIRGRGLHSVGEVTQTCPEFHEESVTTPSRPSFFSFLGDIFQYQQQRRHALVVETMHQPLLSGDVDLFGAVYAPTTRRQPR